MFPQLTASVMNNLGSQPTTSMGSAQSTFTPPSTNNQILTGASIGPAPTTTTTTKAPTTTTNNNSGQNLDQLWRSLGNSGDRPVGWNGPGGGSSVNLPSLDSLYAPIFANYDQMQGQIQGQQTNALNDLTSSYNNNMGLIPGYQQKQQQVIDQNQFDLQNQIQNATDQANRNYQWANQANLNTYGYNGAFLGGNALAGTELAREQGQIGQQGVQGQMQIGQQRTDLSNWAQTQQTTLNNQYMGAKDNLNQYFQQQLFSLQNDRNATEAQKAAGKIQLLQDVMNQNNAIEQQAINFQQQLQLFNSQMGNTAGQAYSMPNALQQAYANLQQSVNQNVAPQNQSFGVATGQNPSSLGAGWYPNQNTNNDAFNKLAGSGGAVNLPATIPVPTFGQSFGQGQ